MLTFVSISICFSAELVRSQTIDTVPAANLTQTLPQPAIPPPQNILPPPRPETPALPAPQTSPPQPPSNDLLQPPVQSPPSSQTPVVTPGTITVEQFRFIGNTAFTSKTLEKLLSPFTKKPITFAQLLQASIAVANLYKRHGYITSGALTPANQAINSGVVTIRVIEGRVEKIQVTGTRRLNPNYSGFQLDKVQWQPVSSDSLAPRCTPLT